MLQLHMLNKITVKRLCLVYQVSDQGLQIW